MEVYKIIQIISVCISIAFILVLLDMWIDIDKHSKRSIDTIIKITILFIAISAILFVVDIQKDNKYSVGTMTNTVYYIYAYFFTFYIHNPL